MRTTAFASLLLCTFLSTASSLAFSDAPEACNCKIDHGEHALDLVSVKTFSIGGHDSRIQMHLRQEAMTQKKWNKLIFDLSGTAVFREVDSDGKMDQTVDTLMTRQDAEGAASFAMVHEDEHSKIYIGFSCDRTYASCVMPDTELSFRKDTGQWFLSNREHDLKEVELIAH